MRKFSMEAQVKAVEDDSLWLEGTRAQDGGIVTVDSSAELVFSHQIGSERIEGKIEIIRCPKELRDWLMDRMRDNRRVKIVLEDL